MPLFTKDPEAKARRTQEREEQQKKAQAVAPPCVHTPTHALKDSLLSVPDAYEGTDKQRLKEAHRHRLEREVSALASGSDTSATKTPANYWQGQPLPAQFKAPTPAGLRKLALSRPSLKGRKIKLPKTLPAQQQSQTLLDEGYESDVDVDGTSKRSRRPARLAKGPAQEPLTTQPRQDEAAEAGRDAELERLRSKIRELEAKQIGRQNEQGPVGHRSALTNATAQNASSPKPADFAGRHSAPAGKVDLVDGLQSRSSSSESWKWLSSGSDNKKKSDATPPTPLSVEAGSDRINGMGIDRYDWAAHWARLAARTEEERGRLPPAINPQERPAPVATPPPEAEVKTYYADLDDLNRIYPAAPEGKPSSKT